MNVIVDVICLRIFANPHLKPLWPPDLFHAYRRQCTQFHLSGVHISAEHHLLLHIITRGSLPIGSGKPHQMRGNMILSIAKEHAKAMAME